MAMRCSRSIFSTATALHRVFITPIEQSNLLLTQRLPPPRTIFSPSVLQTRCYAGPAPIERRLPHDDLIESWSIALVNEDGTLSPSRSKHEVLESLDRSTQTLVQVAPSQPGTLPICKIMNKRAMREAEKAKAKAARSGAAAAGSKTLELNWAIDQGDLRHRLEKMKKFLEKGLRVEIALASKRKGKQATPEEAQALLKRIREVVKEQGAKEMKPMEGQMLRTATLYLGKVEQG
jgi:translation initiation factor IF-3